MLLFGNCCWRYGGIVVGCGRFTVTIYQYAVNLYSAKGMAEENWNGMPQANCWHCYPGLPSTYFSLSWGHGGKCSIMEVQLTTNTLSSMPRINSYQMHLEQWGRSVRRQQIYLLNLWTADTGERRSTRDVLTIPMSRSLYTAFQQRRIQRKVSVKNQERTSHFWLIMSDWL